MKISINPYDAKSIDKALREVIAFKNDFNEKIELLNLRIQQYCESFLNFKYGSAILNPSDEKPIITSYYYDGTIIIRAEGEDLYFIEFGAGLIGYGNPMAEELGYGPSTWSDEGGKGHWDNPSGWWFKRNGATQHSIGNYPARAFYDLMLALQEDVYSIVYEVFNDR